MHCVGEVLTWKFTKNLKFSSVEDQMNGLQQRLISQGKTVTEFYSDNCCCTWRNILQDVFSSNLKVLLDIFHAIQRVTNKMSKRHPLNMVCVQDLKLAFRDPSDSSAIATRQKSTPDKTILRQSLNAFVSKWKDI